MSFWTIIKDFFKKSEDVLFSPEKCICCGREKIDETSPFCDRCKESLVMFDGKICETCGRPISDGKVCDKCKNLKFDYDLARACFAYDKNSSQMITRFKYSKAKYLVNRLSDMLVYFYKNHRELETDIVTFIPMTNKKQKERGFNQTEELALAFCEKLNLACECLLSKIKDTPAQAGLDKDKRLKNLKGAFSLVAKNRRLIKGKRILIIDDVFTTGSTSSECAKLLKRAGASGVFVLTLAKTI